MEDADEKELREFSWVGLFMVTGICFFGFSLLIKLLDGSHVPIFIKIGLVSLGLAAICFLNKWVSLKEVKRNQRKISPLYNKD